MSSTLASLMADFLWCCHVLFHINVTAMHVPLVDHIFIARVSIASGLGMRLGLPRPEVRYEKLRA